MVHGEKPHQIAKDYAVAAQTISNRASLEGWREDSVRIGKDVMAEAIDRRKALMQLYQEVYLTGMLQVARWMQDRGDPTMLDGEPKWHFAYVEILKAGKAFLDGADTGGDESAPPPDDIDPADAVEAIKRITGE